MKTIKFEVPDALNLKEYDYLMIIATKLYHECKLSLGQAADLVGISKRTFIELLGKYGVSVFSDSIEDLKSDIENA